MKNLWLVGLLLLTMCSVGFAQASVSIDTSFKACKAVKIVPKVLQVNYPETDTCTHVGYFKGVISDNGKMVVECFFGNSRRNVMPRSYTLTDEEFAYWDKSPEQLILILCRYFNVQIE